MFNPKLSSMDIKRALAQYMGSVSEREKEEVNREISEGSHPSREYFIMLVISAIIATVGLLTNSVAVIIGAMLVSPLLLPVIGISLGAVRGDFRLFYRALEAEAKGIIFVVALVVALTLIIPNAEITSEILVRTHPTPLDLMVALASGAAAAYALSKKNIGATLPGVAIAVAVMPPLSVVGIGFALRRLDIAIGGLLTFAANIVAINFAASAVFWLLNFSPRWSLSAEKETLQKLKTSAVLLLVIFIPLAWIMWQSIEDVNTRSTIEKVMTYQLDGISGAQLTAIGFEHAKNGAIAVSASIDSPTGITNQKADEMRLALEKNLHAQVILDLRVNLVNLITSENSGTP